MKRLTNPPGEKGEKDLKKDKRRKGFAERTNWITENPDRSLKKERWVFVRGTGTGE